MNTRITLGNSFAASSLSLTILFLAFVETATAQSQRDPGASADAVWPALRGPGARGVADGARFPEHWSANENVAWKRDLPGRGWSSPVVAGNRVFLTTVVSEIPPAEAKKGLYFGGNQSKPPDDPHRWDVVCLDLETGAVAWQQTVHKGIPRTPRHIKNSYASETPVTDGERVYFLFGDVGLYCFTVDGRPVWSKPLPATRMRFDWGPAASPVLYGERIYLVNDNEDESYLAALDKRTGNEIWRIPRDEKSNWATPFVWKNERRTEIVVPATGKVRSYDLDGKLLYEFGGCSTITIATPYTEGGLLYVTSGYVNDEARPIFAVRPGASGDISLASDQTSNAFIAWCEKQGAPYNPSTIVYGGILYVLHDRGLLEAFDAATGKQLAPRRRIPNGGTFTSSPWAANGLIHYLNEDGVTFTYKAGSELELLHTSPLGEDDMCMATPPIAGDRLLVRTAARVYCIGGKRAAAR
jgi:outer membrane protein assembly factor BamB